EGPAWSPDGGRIAYSASESNGTPEIFTMNADGTDVTQLTTDSAQHLFPVWSPDGGRIAFSTNSVGNQQFYQVYVMHADGSNVTQLTTTPSRKVFLSWTKGGP
ncbi:MAG: TolB family protein, partial [Chloroflexota bacterium]